MSELGSVTKVDVNTDKNRIFVNVSTGPTTHYDSIAFRSPGSGVWIVPEKGDVVEVEEVGGRHVAFAPHSPPSFSFPSSLSEGDVAIKVNKNSYIHLDKQDDGTVDLRLDVDGDIYIGDSTSATKVARQDHTHTDSSGGQTSKPNEAGTSTQIE